MKYAHAHTSTSWAIFLLDPGVFFLRCFFLCHHILCRYPACKMISEGTSTSEDTVKKTVLCVFKERRRPVTFITSSDKNVERKNLLDAVRASFADVLFCGEGTSDTRSYFFQTESSEWGRIDLTGCEEDRATIYLCYSADVSTCKQLCIVFRPFIQAPVYRLSRSRNSKVGVQASILCQGQISVKPRLSADIYYRPPNLRVVYARSTENIRDTMKGGQSSHSLWTKTRTSKLTKAIFMDW